MGIKVYAEKDFKGEEKDLGKKSFKNLKKVFLSKFYCAYRGEYYRSKIGSHWC